ncbi:DUF4082 domain-containing protein [Rhizohabitans arisaemae]|uniref:DUF4082 domain-containing protein n=1 Tax=Rhizohabitans arisaemae TaxID=2720610 RepID=UPI0024B08A6E|nr:DUF4082 domain-containing protein [Rhizohabitans arisaemae]
MSSTNDHRHDGPEREPRRRVSRTTMAALLTSALLVVTVPVAIWALRNAPKPEGTAPVAPVPVSVEEILEASFWEPAGQVKARKNADRAPVELGVKFTPDRDGAVTAIRFYKASGERGKHVGTLWDAQGKVLGRVNFGRETKSGWQQAAFATPVNIKAGRVYTVSYHTTYGTYVASRDFFNSPHTAGPLTAPAGGNGVFAYGKTSRFPANAHRSNMNYYVDLVFRYKTLRTVPAPTGSPSAPSTQVPEAPRPTVTPKPTVKPSPTATVKPTEPTENPTLPRDPEETPTAKPTTKPSPPAQTPTEKPTQKPTEKPSPPVETPTETPSTEPPTNNPVPPSGDFPNESNTGPAAGTLKKIPGGQIRENGKVLDGVEITGGLDVYANNVTIRNCRMIVDGYWAIQLRDGFTGLTVENCEIGSNGSRLGIGISNAGDGAIFVRRNNIHGTSNSGVTTSNGVVEGNYIHSLKRVDSTDHVDGIQNNGSKAKGSLLIRGNTVINPGYETSAIILGAAFGPIHDVRVEGNLLGGGGYCIYGGAKHAGHAYAPYNVVIKDNVFSSAVFAKCGAYGPVAHFDEGAPGHVWSGNVWEDTGVTIGPDGKSETPDPNPKATSP